MPKYTDLKGKIFGRLTVLEYLGTKNNSANWKCGCRCGFYTEATIGDLNRTNRPKRSCGKCQADHRWPSEWLAWRNCITRCYHQESKDYPNWGGRGITVCKEWRDDFFNFLEDMGLKEHLALQLDREDNDGNYNKNNCRWATKSEQMINRRPFTRSNK